MQRELIEKIKQINDEISEASSLINKSRNDITLIAVSKKKSHELIEIAFQNGVNNFGENYAQELEEKSSLINSSEIIWHFIGPIQSNKVKVIARCADWVHTLDRKKVVVKLNNECKKENKVINACIQVNISNEESKSGCNPEDLLNLAKLIESMENINLKGIMALPKLTNDKNEREHMMQSVKKLSIELQSVYSGATHVSLGTTSDFHDAIINGANMVRIGESIFGKRL
mgnify:FL=1